MHVVSAGESVQAALDAAAPGDTVELAPGTHPGSVRITRDHVTLRGPRDAVLTPGPADRARAAETPADCSAGGYGVCVIGTAERPVTGVSVVGLSITGFRKSGVMGRHADGLTVSGVRATGNGEHGIGQEFSARGVFTGNTAADNAQSGLFVGDEPAGTGTLVAGNRAEGNRIGVHVRRVRGVDIAGNTLTGNCAGVFVVGDETRPVAGDLDVTGNTIEANNRFCPGNSRIAHIQGSGIVLTGAQDVRMTGNRITDHQGDSPMSGGIVTVPSFAGDGTSFHTATGNTVLRNAPADIAERDPRGTGNTYAANACATSLPAGRCPAR